VLNDMVGRSHLAEIAHQHPTDGDLSFSGRQGFGQAYASERGERCVSQFNQK
jgi:hypothetical protein